MFANIIRSVLAASALLLSTVLISDPAAARGYLQCVPFARAESGIEIYGNARTWWAQAASDYGRGSAPREGAVMAFSGTRSMPHGHVAVVKKIVNDREILIDHANWSPINGRRGQIERNVRVVDVSDAGDWSAVRVWYAPIGALGRRVNPVQGFIYGEGDAAPENAAPQRPALERPIWTKNDWSPGNGLERVVASLGN
nr:CHAP domain-containing protein [Sphingopyxis sp. MWB1]